MIARFRRIIVIVLVAGIIIAGSATTAYGSLPVGTLVTATSNDVLFHLTVSGIPVSITCTSFSYHMQVTGTNYLSGHPPKESPIFAGCTDNLGGTVTITTTSTDGPIATNSADGHWEFVAKKSGITVTLVIPEKGAVLTSTAFPAGCEVEFAPKGPVDMPGTYSSSGGTDSISDGSIPVKGDASCSAISMSLTTTLTFSPNPGTIPPWAGSRRPNVFIADSANDRVVKVPKDGGAETTVGTGLYYPEGVAVDAAGNVFIADTLNRRVVEVPAAGGPQTTIGTGLTQPSGVAVDAAGNVFIADQVANDVVEVPADGGPQTTIGTGLSDPSAVAVDAAGDVFIADSGHNRVLEVPAGGGPQITVGTGLSDPLGVAVDAAGDVFIADTSNNRVVEVPADGGPQITVGTGLNTPNGVAVMPR
jgi:sugar lactone lactonase YvrE